jgi:tRNA pseudouridine13 synthase
MVMTHKPVPQDLPGDPWPVAFPGFRPAGRYRVAAEDFEVSEVLPFAPEGEGNHWLLRVRKVGVNTDRVAKDLAREAGCRPRDVGYAGLKDRHAVAVQHFTVPTDRLAASPEQWAGQSWRVVAADRVRKKLQRGALAGNRFRLLLRLAPAARCAAGARLERAAIAGVPNYFGPQRFGRGGGNVSGAREWFSAGREPGRRDRGMYLSAARSYLFNRVLARRIADGTWDRLLPGELAVFAGSNSGFVVADPAQEVRRLAIGDIHPSGPLPGEAGGLAPAGEALSLEDQLLTEEGELVAGLVAQRVKAHRRALRVIPSETAWEPAEEGIRIAFTLPAGAFATSVVREVISVRSEEKRPSHGGGAIRR